MLGRPECSTLGVSALNHVLRSHPTVHCSPSDRTGAAVYNMKQMYPGCQRSCLSAFKVSPVSKVMFYHTTQMLLGGKAWHCTAGGYRVCWTGVERRLHV